MSSLFGPAMSPGGTASVEPDRARYQLFGVLPDSRPDTADEASVAEALEACRAACMSHLEPHLDGYIWQRDPSARGRRGLRGRARPPRAPRRRHRVRRQRGG